jgi:hypothetical protein
LWRQKRQNRTRMIIKLIDSCLNHIPEPVSMQGYDEPKHIVWDRGGAYHDITVYTDHFLHKAHLDHNDSRIQIAWLMEPQVINNRSYEAIKQHHKYYNYVMSHDQNFLSRFVPKEKCVWIPASGSSLYSDEWQIYPKNKMVMTIVGEKHSAVGHRFRYEVVQKLAGKMDVVGRGFKPFPPEKKAETLAPYMYQVCIHNTPVPDYWSDILLDGIATGTVPIVWHGKYLKKYFNMDGIMTFNSVEELIGILASLSEEDYASRLVAVNDNFNVAFNKYKVIEDFMYETLFKTLE